VKIARSLIPTPPPASWWRSPTRSRRSRTAASNIERVNGPFLEQGGTPDQYRAALARAIKLGWLSLHESGTYVKFTSAGAEMFA
jgi:hypothetical protein